MSNDPREPVEHRFTAAEDADKAFKAWIRERVEAEPYWFQKISLWPDLVTPGWSDPATEKLPYYGLPADMTGMRVLDVGCAEGFFSFEAERCGASEIVSIDSFPDSVRRFNLCRDVFRSRATPYLCNVYDLSPKTFGTFDLVMFFGVLYHLRHPLLALEKILSVCTGTLLVQTAGREEPGTAAEPLAYFYPRGITSGPPEDRQHDPTVFWLPNRECVRAMADHAGFLDIETVCDNDRVTIVLRARGPLQERGRAPDQEKAPWS